eukprot:SAG22_NODE_188_length_15821_cov_38.313319_13_plen_75_part_00
MQQEIGYLKEAAAKARANPAPAPEPESKRFVPPVSGARAAAAWQRVSLFVLGAGRWRWRAQPRRCRRAQRRSLC